MAIEKIFANLTRGSYNISKLFANNISSAVASMLFACKKFAIREYSNLSGLGTQSGTPHIGQYVP